MFLDSSFGGSHVPESLSNNVNLNTSFSSSDLGLIPLSFSIVFAPIFVVITINVFEKLITFPLESVRRPSSKICNIILKTSGCAFSTSSKRTTEYGFVRTASVN